jgi:Fe-S oxidoreductase
MAPLAPYLEVAEVIIDYGGVDLYDCFGCGTCTGLCPWNLVRDLNVRTMIRRAMLGLEGVESEDLWLCATCGYCVANCPREVSIIDLIRSMRQMIGEAGSMPKSLRSMLASQRDNGNPWMGEPADRNNWVGDRDIDTYTSDKEWLLYSCCTACYEPANVGVNHALANVFKSAGISFGISPPQAVCCGDSVRESGDAETVEALASQNIKLFDELGVKKIVTSSPHCLNAFQKDYPKHGGEYQTEHYTVVFADLIEKGALKMTGSRERVITYHDPCYLGRHNGIYDQPRDIIRSIPGAKFVELKRIRENALCCGGGGGRMFMETEKGERFSDLRVAEALEVGADTIATACSYCNVMFRDSIKSMNVEDKIEVLDIAELVDEVL